MPCLWSRLFLNWSGVVVPCAALGMGSMKAATARRPQKRGVQKPARKESLAKSAVAYAVADLPYHYDDVPGFFEPEPLAPAMSAEDAALALVNLSGSLSGPIWYA